MAIINNDILKSIKLIAIDNYSCNTIEWFVEQACRYYSKTYHTPLHIVRGLNPVDVVQVFMEDELTDMPPEDVIAMKEKLEVKYQPMLDPEAYAEEEQELMSDDEWIAQQMLLAQKQEEKPKEELKGPSMEDAAAQAMSAMQNLYKQLNKDIPEDVDSDIKFNKEDE